jgi:GntR family transcriptional regulator, transcriptional repressor for pyruvate dehydrogenase complex
LIATHIVEQGLTDGDRLPNEAVLHESLQVGRSTLREALRLLETQGILTIRAGPGGGPVIRTPRSEDLTGSIALHLQMRRATLDMVAEARMLISPLIARLAARRRTAPQLEALETHVAAERDAFDASQDEFTQLLIEFHQLMAQAAGNVLIEVYDATTMRIFQDAGNAPKMTPRRRREATALHESVLAAIAAGDEEAAAEALSVSDQRGYAWLGTTSRSHMDSPIVWH